MAGLSRDRIVAAAYDFVERHGHEQLSLRKLATELGVTAPALYDHVASRDELLRAVAVQGYEELAAVTVSHESTAIGRVRARAFAYVDFAQRRPELFRLMFMYRPNVVMIEADNELNEASEAFDRGTVDVVAAIADGDLVDRDPTELGLILWTVTHGVATVSLMAPPVGAAVAADVVDAVLAGLRPPG